MQNGTNVKKRVLLSLLCIGISCNLVIVQAYGLKAAEVRAGGDDQKNGERDAEISDVRVQNILSAETLWLNFHEEVTISTRHEVPIERAPNIVTVIMYQDIKNAGHRALIDVLRTVPGFEILKASDLGTSFPTVRGISAVNRVRVMINGHLINNPVRGDAFFQFDDYPIENIKRLEIIRGPGSAVYGENAFLATINIITKDAGDIDGIKVSSGYGSFGTKEGDIVFGKVFDTFEISGMIHYIDTDGYDGTLESDLQTKIDNVIAPFGFPSSSRTPEDVVDFHREYDFFLNVLYKDFYFQGGYFNEKRGPFVSPLDVLSSDTSSIGDNYYFAEIGYKKSLDNKLTLKPRIYYDQFDTSYDIDSLPEGSVLPMRTDRGRLPFTFVSYPDGLKGQGGVSVKVAGMEVPVDYILFDGNIMTLGFEYRFTKQTNIRNSGNFHPVTFQPLDSNQSFSDSFPWIKDANRNLWSVYIQDVWDITDTINLTLGIRHDEYNDFNSTNPRLGMSWSFLENASLKILYGKAFRVPSFLEMYSANQPAILGNENLDPETIDTFEVGVSYKLNDHVTSRINYFYNDVEDLIELRSDSTKNISRYENMGDAHIQGIEFETQVNITKGNYVYMNYTFQDPQDNHGKTLPNVSKHKGNVGMNAAPWKYVNANLNAFFSGKRYREEGDARNDLPFYSLLNLSLLGKGFYKTMEAQATVYNLLDKDYDDPGQTTIHDDLPRPGRMFFIGLSYEF
ncbi:MAG: TonB-dependent receptor [Candidatus Brocadiaceae bacterium]|nr:TonB-dependent receptor [Candidatus Brocadiaceae bacterium]